MTRPRIEFPEYKLVKRGPRWYVAWRVSGKPQRVSTGTSERSKAARFLAQFVAGTASKPKPPRVTIGVILDGYLLDRAGNVKALATLRHAANALRLHLNDLEPDHLTKTRARLYAKERRADRPDKPISNGTIIREIVTLRAALRWAVAERWIDRAPDIEAPSAPPPRSRWLTREEAERLKAAAHAPHIRLFIELALSTGARAGALLELTWQQVDLESGIVTLGRGTGKKRRATVPMTVSLRRELEAAYAGAISSRVIEHGGEGVLSVKTGFRNACKRAGLEDVTPHVLRHTAASWLIQGGISFEQAAMWLGNSAAMIERVYGHMAPDHLRNAANVLERVS